MTTTTTTTTTVTKTETKTEATTKKTHVVICLDESGSMGSIRDNAIEFFNDQVKTIKDSKTSSHNVDISLVKFGTDGGKVVTEFWSQNVATLQPITQENYKPSGSTPMNDAIGGAITRLRNENGDPGDDEAFLIIIISDGMENASRDFTGKDIGRLVEECEGTGKWTFTFLGANVDLKTIKDTYKFQAGNIAAFSATADGVTEASVLNAAGTASYFNARAGGHTRATAFYAGSQPRN